MAKLTQEELQAELLVEFNAGMDEREYNSLDRQDPWLAGMISRMVSAGYSPEKIQAGLTQNQPHHWILGQSVKAAARHVWRVKRGENEQ